MRTDQLASRSRSPKAIESSKGPLLSASHTRELVRSWVFRIDVRTGLAPSMILVDCPRDIRDENIDAERDCRKYCMVMPVWFYSEGGFILRAERIQ